MRTGWPAAAAAAGLAVVVTAGTGVLRGLELPLRDAMVRTLPHRAPALVAAVVVDDASLAAEGPWPWPRPLLADLLGAVRDAGARGVVLDVLLLDARPGDDALAAAMRPFPTVLVAALDNRAARWLAPVPPLAGAARLAHGMFELDHDGVLRRLVSTKQAAGAALPAVAFAAAALAAPALAIPVGRVVQPGFRVTPQSVPTVSAARLLHGQGGNLLRGRLVFVGLTAAGLGDRVVTPVTAGPVPDPGVLVQAAVTEAIVRGDLLHPVPPLLAGVAAMALVLAAGAVSRLGGGRRLAGDALLLALPLAAGVLLLRLADIVMPTATLSVLALLVVIVMEARNGLVAWRSAGATGATLAAAGGGEAPSGRGSLAGRLGIVERLASAAARRRVADEEARRVMAHELKTPLTSVRGLGQMLRDLDLAPAERRRASELLVAEADRLQVMIEHLTELERLSRRPFEADATPVDLSALVRARAEVLGRGHDRPVGVDVAPGLYVSGDAALLERVFDNLLGNAFKFSPPDTAVEVRAFAAGTQAVVEVRDHGCGVAPEEREMIFRRFARGAAAQGREGLGLGLALVREVLTWHGGQVTVESPEDGGSVFRVTIPAARGGAGGGEDPRRR
jgi:signal transduction histidine kinase